MNVQDLEAYFQKYTKEVIGENQEFETPYGVKKIVYADWIASGRMYHPIEDTMLNEIYPFVANTHTETNVTGSSMTLAYKQARKIIKQHVNATASDILISSNSGMTGVVNKLQRIIGIKIHEKFAGKIKLNPEERPIVFVTHMEHHSNQTSWLETIADVVVIKPTEEGLVDLKDFETLLHKYQDRPMKIAALTSCSNVTGIFTPYYQMAKMIHAYGGYCFVDFACSAPYIKIDMHPEDPESYLDAIYFSPHKFLGGPSSSGILIFNSKLYTNKIPDAPGGGTVEWTNPWGEHIYSEEIEAREDGGTPSFIQTIRVALAIQLKEQMGVDNIALREKEILEKVWKRFDEMENVVVLASNQRLRLPVFSFYIKDVHYNLVVKILNDRFGVQVRGGCSCAGTYGHYLLDFSREKSKQTIKMIQLGNLNFKPGWVRVSFHPIMSNQTIHYIMDSIALICAHHEEWEKEYMYDTKTNEYLHHSENYALQKKVSSWFDLSARKDKATTTFS